jgi:hypothetical protein
MRVSKITAPSRSLAFIPRCPGWVTGAGPFGKTVAVVRACPWMTVVRAVARDEAIDMK